MRGRCQSAAKRDAGTASEAVASGYLRARRLRQQGPLRFRQRRCKDLDRVVGGVQPVHLEVQDLRGRRGRGEDERRLRQAKRRARRSVRRRHGSAVFVQRRASGCGIDVHAHMDPALQREETRRLERLHALCRGPAQAPATVGVDEDIEASVGEGLLCDRRRCQLLDRHLAVRGIALERHPERQRESGARVQLDLCSGTTREAIGPPGQPGHARHDVRRGELRVDGDTRGQLATVEPIEVDREHRLRQRLGQGSRLPQRERQNQQQHQARLAIDGHFQHHSPPGTSSESASVTDACRAPA
jgi:hypothetical protein